MKKYEAIAKAMESNSKTVIINKKDKIAFCKFENCNFFEYTIRCERFVDNVNWMLNNMLDRDGWEVLTEGELVKNFAPRNTPWVSGKYRELTVHEAAELLLDKMDSIKVEVNDEKDTQTWVSRQLVGIKVDNRCCFCCKDGVYFEYWRYCRILEE